MGQKNMHRIKTTTLSPRYVSNCVLQERLPPYPNLWQMRSSLSATSFQPLGSTTGTISKPLAEEELRFSRFKYSARRDHVPKFGADMESGGGVQPVAAQFASS